MEKVKLVLIWITGIMFIATGALKLIHLDKMSLAIFDRAHYPSWLFYVAGLFELAGGIMLIIRSTRRWGSAMIVAVMLGALGTHFILKDDFTHFLVPVAIILLLGLMTARSR